MDVFLGLLGIAVWIIVVLALAMGITWLVVKISPSGNPKKPNDRGAAS